MRIQVDESVSLELVDDQHAEQIFQLVNANRQQLREWLPWVDRMETIDFIRNFISDSRKRMSEQTDYAFVLLMNDRVIGRVGVYKIDLQNKTGSIGYWLDAAFQGKGIMTKACEVLIDYCFDALALNRIEIRCGTKNFKSQSIPTRLNFKNEGIVRDGELVHEQFIDLCSYSMIKREWKKVAGS